MTNPCRYCQKRNATCHSNCEQYKSWLIEYQKIKSEAKKKELSDYNYFYHK